MPWLFAIRGRVRGEIKENKTKNKLLASPSEKNSRPWKQSVTPPLEKYLVLSYVFATFDDVWLVWRSRPRWPSQEGCEPWGTSSQPQGGRCRLDGFSQLSWTSTAHLAARWRVWQQPATTTGKLRQCSRAARSLTTDWAIRLASITNCYFNSACPQAAFHGTWYFATLALCGKHFLNNTF